MGANKALASSHNQSQAAAHNVIDSLPPDIFQYRQIHLYIATVPMVPPVRRSDRPRKEPKRWIEEEPEYNTTKANASKTTKVKASNKHAKKQPKGKITLKFKGKSAATAKPVGVKKKAAKSAAAKEKATKAPAKEKQPAKATTKRSTQKKAIVEAAASLNDHIDKALKDVVDGVVDKVVNAGVEEENVAADHEEEDYATPADQIVAPYNPQRAPSERAISKTPASSKPQPASRHKEPGVGSKGITDLTDEDDEKEDEDDAPSKTWKKPADSGRASVETEDNRAATVNTPALAIPPRTSSFPATKLEKRLQAISRG